MGDFLDRAYGMSRVLLQHSASSMNRLAAELTDDQIASYVLDRTRHQQNDRKDFMQDSGVKAHRKFKKQLVSSLEYTLGGGKYSGFIRMYNDKLVRWISDFSARLTPEQREHFRERLDDLADELDSIGR